MSFNIGGVNVPGCVVKAIETGKNKAQQVVQQAINDVMSDPAKNIKQTQQPSGLSSFMDIRV
jgi:hypothetical protein